MTRILEGGGVVDDSALAIEVWAGDETASDADQAGFLAKRPPSALTGTILPSPLN